MTDHEHSEDCGCQHEAIVQLLQGTQRSRPPADQLRAFDTTLEQLGTKQGVADRRVVARALYAKGQALAALGRHGEAVAACLDLERRAERDEDVEVQVSLGEALAGMALSYRELWMPDLGRQVYRRAIARFRDAKNPALRVFAPRALCDDSIAARLAGDTDASTAIASEAWEAFGHDENDEVRRWAEKARSLAHSLDEQR